MLQSPSTYVVDNITFDTWVDDENEMNLSCMDDGDSFEEKKRKLLERIKEHQLSTDRVKTKKARTSYSAGKTRTTKQSSKITKNQTAVQPCTTIIPTYQDEDVRYELQFRKHLSPKIPPIIRCDGLAEFPIAFTNCLNSGNNEGLADLVRSHLDHRCDIRLLAGASSLSCASFLKFFELINEIHPDRILHVNSTNMANNQVTAALYMKYTDCKALYHAVARTVTDPSLFRVVPATRAQYIAARIQVENQSEEEQQKLINLVESDFDLVVYGCIYVTITFDNETRKATALQMAGNLTSAHVAEITDS